MSKKPRGYIDLVLFMDAETSGIAMGQDDPSYDPTTNKEYQAVSWGFVVANAHTLKPIETLYIEVKWNGDSEWSMEAQKIHGLTPKYLEENGVSEEDAVIQIAELLMKYWGPDGVVCVGGHNVATFDLFFFKRLLRKFELPVRFGSKTIDTNAIGFATFATHNSDDLFETVGLPPRTGEHNALTDADNARETVRRVRAMFAHCIDGQ